MGGNGTMLGGGMSRQRECNTWSFCTSPIGCSTDNGKTLAERVSTSSVHQPHVIVPQSTSHDS